MNTKIEKFHYDSHIKSKSFAVIDTNVLVSAVGSTKTPETSAPMAIIGLIETYNIIPIVDERIIEEYINVLYRERYSKVYPFVNHVINLIIETGLLVKNVEKCKYEIWDSNDIMLLEVTLSTEDLKSKLITYDSDDFAIKQYTSTGTPLPKDLTLMAIEQGNIVSPPDFIKILRALDNEHETMQKELGIKIDYNELFQRKYDSALACGRYEKLSNKLKFVSESRSFIRMDNIKGMDETNIELD